MKRKRNPNISLLLAQAGLCKFSEKPPVQSEWNKTRDRRSGRFSYNSSHWQQVNKLTQIQDTELGLLFSTQAPSSNSTRMWFNTSMQWPSSPKPTCWRKRSCAACRQFPSFLCTGWLQSTLRYIHKFHLFYPKTDLLLEPPLKSKTWYISQVTKDLVGKPHGILTFLAKYYLYFGF